MQKPFSQVGKNVNDSCKCGLYTFRNNILFRLYFYAVRFRTFEKLLRFHNVLYMTCHKLCQEILKNIRKLLKI